MGRLVVGMAVAREVEVAQEWERAELDLAEREWVEWAWGAALWWEQARARDRVPVLAACIAVKELMRCWWAPELA